MNEGENKDSNNNALLTWFYSDDLLANTISGEDAGYVE
jgi:hypothetical protein